MSVAVETAAAAEAEVERARAALAVTISELRDNLKPRHLIGEVMERPRAGMARWLGIYGRFAAHSPVSGVIIGAAALALTSSLVFGRRRRP